MNLNVFIVFSFKSIDMIVFVWIMPITNLGWVQSFFSILDTQPRRESESGSDYIHSVRFYYIISE